MYSPLSLGFTCRLGAILLCVAGCAHETPQVSRANMTPLAGGFLARELVPGEKPPSDDTGRPAQPKVTSDFNQPPNTNDWWSSMIWRYRDKDGNPYSEDMHPHPLTLRARSEGLELGYPSTPVVDGTSYDHPHRADLVIGVSGLNAKDTRVASYSDWTVTAEWQDGEHTARMTFGHGLPFVYVTSVQGDALVTWQPQDDASVQVRQGNIATLKVRGHHYALFAPPGSSWTVHGTQVTSSLAGKGYYAAALLPDGEDNTLALFTRHAFAFVTGSRVAYRFDPEQGSVVAAFSLETQDMRRPDGGAGVPLSALYRHQWMSSTAARTGKSYASARGEMKLIALDKFEVNYPLGGLLPALPHLAKSEQAKLVGLLRMAANGELFPPGLEGSRDSYWDGKNFGRTSDVVYLADQLDKTRIRDRLLGELKTELEDWFDGQFPRYFYRDDTWKTVIGVPSVYYSGSMLNDHHFHYAYFIFAAATVAQFDRAWAVRWAPYVETLIKDAANWDRKDDSFPFMRCFDLYAGHSWAAGTPFSERGNNEESSSEDVNFAAAVALWGEVMGHAAIRDAGLFMYATLVRSIEQYWFDVDREVFPKGFAHPSLGILWGSGGLYDTWFSKDPAFIHGIQFTPISAGSLWLARRPDNLRRNLAHLHEMNEGKVHLWRDLFTMVLALQDPAKAYAEIQQEHYYQPELGNTMVHTYHWAASLSVLGRLVPDVTADAPFHAVFDNEGVRTHVAFHGGSSARPIRFSDGTVLQAEPLKLTHDRK